MGFPAQIRSKIGFLKKLDLYKWEKPFNLNFPVSNIPGARQTNVEYEYVDDILITDIRGNENAFHLDIHGFQVFHQPFKYSLQVFDDPAQVCKTYCRDMEEYLKEVLLAETVYIYDSQVRRRDASRRVGQDEPPITGAHVDQTPQSNKSRLEFELGIDPTKVTRYEIINLWRPLIGPCDDFPLALCDYRSIDQERDLEREDLISPHYHGEGFLVYSNPKHLWYYLGKMMPNEIFLMKQSDSQNHGPFVVHAAITDPTVPDTVRPRESVEVRAIVVNSRRSVPLIEFPSL